MLPRKSAVNVNNHIHLDKTAVGINLELPLVLWVLSNEYFDAVIIETDVRIRRDRVRDTNTGNLSLSPLLGGTYD